MWDDVGKRDVLLGGEDDEHADAAAMVRQLNHLVFLPLGRSGHAWQGSKVNREGENRANVIRRCCDRSVRVSWEQEKRVNYDNIHLAEVFSLTRKRYRWSELSQPVLFTERQRSLMNSTFVWDVAHLDNCCLVCFIIQNQPKKTNSTANQSPCD